MAQGTPMAELMLSIHRSNPRGIAEPLRTVRKCAFTDGGGLYRIFVSTAEDLSGGGSGGMTGSSSHLNEFRLNEGSIEGVGRKSLNYKCVVKLLRHKGQ
jgi:hypothetical protein